MDDLLIDPNVFDVKNTHSASLQIPTAFHSAADTHDGKQVKLKVLIPSYALSVPDIERVIGLASIV